MGDSDFDDDDSFSDLDEELIARTGVNRQVRETVVRHVHPVQRTLTGERLAGEPVDYEEIRREVTFKATHHALNKENLDTYLYPSNFQIRDYQYEVIARALYENVLCAIPTGMGKTFIASTVMLNYYRWFKKGKIIFMAPTRPLVAQQIQACLGVTDIPSGDTAVLLDKTRRNRPEIWNSKRVFFTTPQVVENDLKAGTLDPKEIVCLVIDEAHRGRKNYAYTNVVKFVERFNTSFRVLALTATPAADIEGVQEVVNNLSISAIEIRTEDSPDIKKYMKNKDVARVNVGLNAEMEEIQELLGMAIEVQLKAANEAQIYEVTDPSRINFFQIRQKSAALIANPSIPEGIKWKNYYILQILGVVGQMLRRLKIYGIRTFYNYFVNKQKEYHAKFELGKSSDMAAKSFFYHRALKKIEDICNKLLTSKHYVSHPKLDHLLTELEFFNKNSRAIVFTELRESALEIVQTIDNNLGDSCKAHIFIGQARGKEGFDEVEYKMKNSKKGRGKAAREERLEREQAMLEEKEAQKKAEAEKRAASRTFSSEEAQIQGMTQKQQKEIIKRFKKGEFQVLVATSIGEEGLDIGEVDLIICYDTTSSPIKNIQRMGRTGRKNDGRVLLLLASNEELKFNQAMEEYANVQRQIESGVLSMHKSDRIVPPDVHPRCVKRLIEIPEDNLIIARGEDVDEVIKHATQAMLGQAVGGKKKAVKGRGGLLTATKTNKRTTKFTEPAPPMPKKKFFMPDDVETGFVNSSTLVRKVGGGAASGGNSSRSKEMSISLESDDGEEEEEEEEASKSTKKTSPDTSANTSHILEGLFSSAPKQSTSSRIHTPARTSLPQADSTPQTKTKKPVPEVVDIDNEDDDDCMITEVHDAAEVEVVDVLSARPQQEVQAKDSLQPDPETTPVKSKNDSILNDLTFSEAFDDDEYEEEQVAIPSRTQKKRKNQAVSSDIEDDEIPDTEAEVPNSDDDDSKIFQDTLESIRRARQDGSVLDVVEKPTLTAQLLNFAAYEDNSDDELNPSLRPIVDAAKVMEKQYNQDLSYEYASVPPKEKQSKKRKSVDGDELKSAKKKKPVTTASKMDIAKLLKETKKPVGKKKADLSKVQPSQIIELGSQSQSQYHKPGQKFVYDPQNDPVVSNVFAETDGFLSDEQAMKFVSEYFTNQVREVDADMTLSARRNAFGKIGHGNVSRRFVSFLAFCGPRARKKMNRMIAEYEQQCHRPYDESVKPSDPIVGEHEVEYLCQDEDAEEEKENNHEFPSTVSLLSEDDEMFNDL